MLSAAARPYEPPRNQGRSSILWAVEGADADAEPGGCWRSVEVVQRADAVAGSSSAGACAAGSWPPPPPPPPLLLVLVGLSRPCSGGRSSDRDGECEEEKEVSLEEERSGAAGSMSHCEQEVGTTWEQSTDVGPCTSQKCVNESCHGEKVVSDQVSVSQYHRITLS